MDIKTIKQIYLPGKKVVLYEMKGEPQMPYGLIGIIKFVDDIGQIHVNWENGSSLALNCDEDNFNLLQ